MITDSPGTYILVLHSVRSGNVPIGRCGVLSLQHGWYYYIGSAFGPGGLRGRLAHHLREAASPRWHIDYLRLYCPVSSIWYAAGPEKLEHVWAQAFASMPDLTIPYRRFGSSDCRCLAHLFYSPLNLDAGKITRLPGLPRMW